MRVIISGGGTGGHIYPAIAIANALKEMESDIEILFVGAKNKMEMEKVPAAGYKIEGLWISGLQRRLTADNLMFPLKIISSVIKARKIIKNFKPQVAVGVGGYASWPLLYAANSLGIPTVIQEQNSYAGLTNKMLAKKAGKICVAYENMEKFFPKEKIILTGNPVRKDILDYQTKKEEGYSFFNLEKSRQTILAVGGSLGARTINESIHAQLDLIEKSGVQLIWQTGKWYYQKAKEAVEGKYKYIRVLEFVSRMDLAYAVADTVISRAGALSISELCLVGKPCILVPSPNVAEDHQTKNAMALVKAEAAEMIKDSEAKYNLVAAALSLLKDEQKKKVLSTNIRRLGKPDAAKEIAKIILNYKF